MSIEILVLAFEKAEKEIGSSKKTHLAQHLSDLLQEDYKYLISERTLRDYYTNYKNGTIGKQGDLKPKLIACLCYYLGYKDYADFVSQNRAGKSGGGEVERKKLKEEESHRRIITISISIAFGMALIIFGVQKWYPGHKVVNPQRDKCMTWADSLYVAVSCDTGPSSKYGTDVKPLDPNELQNMRKVEVNAAYQFFSEDGKPLIWYYKNEGNEHEYFTAPGYHPVTHETLKKITPYIIQTYVPIHNTKLNSFREGRGGQL